MTRETIRKLVVTFLMAIFIGCISLIVTACSNEPTPQQKEEIAKYKKGDLAVILLSGQTGMVTTVWCNGCWIRTYQPHAQEAYNISMFKWYEIRPVNKETTEDMGGLY